MSKVGWQTKRLDEVAIVIRGVTYSSGNVLDSKSPGAIMLLRATNIQDGKLDTNEPVYIPRDLVKPIQLLQQHDIVIASSSGSIQVVGKSASVVHSVEATFGAFCTGIRATGVDPRYLAHFLQDPTLRQKWSDLAGGSNINNLKSTDISSTPIPVPPIEEQRRIVETLDNHLTKLDKALAEIQNQIPKVAVTFQALIDRVYWTDEKVHVPLREFGDWVTGSTPSTKNPAYFGGEVPFVTPPEVKNSKKVSTTKRTLTREGALQVRALANPSIHLVCIGTVGKLGFSEELTATNQQITSLLPGSEVDFHYALDLFGSQEAQRRFRKASGKSNMPMLAKGSLLKVEMPLPPIDVQRRLKSEAETLRTEEAITLRRFEAIENKIVQLRRSLLHSAFQGKLGISNG